MMSSVEWNTTIKYYVSSQHKFIYIIFYYRPKETGVDEFIIRLEDIGQTGSNLRLLKSVTISQNEYVFDNLKPGRYRISVEPTNCNFCGRSVTGPLIIESNDVLSLNSLIFGDYVESVNIIELEVKDTTEVPSTALTSDGKPDTSTESTHAAVEITSQENPYTKTDRILAKNSLSSAHTENIISDGNTFIPNNNTRTTDSFGVSGTWEITSMGSVPLTRQNTGILVGALTGFCVLLMISLIYIMYIRRKKSIIWNSNILATSITEETCIVEMRIWCKKIELRNVDLEMHVKYENHSDSAIRTGAIEEAVDNFVKLPAVCIVYAEDHLHHVKVVGAFGKFLDAQCHCNVRYSPWCLREYEDKKVGWFINSTDKADFIILVKSYPTYNQSESWNSKGEKCETSLDHNQMCDSKSQISQITEYISIVNNPFKYIGVSFSNTAENLTLDGLYTESDYLIPEHMYDLICQIHKMDIRRVGNCSIGYFADLLSSTSEGQDLTKCVATSAYLHTQP